MQPTLTVDEQNAQLVQNVGSIDAWRWVSKYVENGSDNIEMNVDGSGGAPVSFFYTPPSSYKFLYSRLVFFMQASSAMSPENFANLPALTNGVKFVVNDVLITTWQTNIDIYTEMYDLTAIANISDVAADTTVTGRWTATKDTFGRRIIVPNGKRFEVIINDDLTSLVEFHIKIKGILVPE